uniref:AlNc14C305G10432 protein n=1 Tax=Albugo laibachii Nc14 TaxID=890382 RepID=F0WVX1_9STRA|nr:AlNc14C305G10432 [Albugo laibachii Nc14]|eukprot:CCA25572.1 AlNc14C305G10432 [Albugo laibachii Nc14]
MYTSQDHLPVSSQNFCPQREKCSARFLSCDYKMVKDIQLERQMSYQSGYVLHSDYHYACSTIAECRCTVFACVVLRVHETILLGKTQSALLLYTQLQLKSVTVFVKTDSETL